MSQNPAVRPANLFSVEAPAASPPSMNPYSPATTISPADAMQGDAETIRRRYLGHEASVKSIGTLYMLGAVIAVPVGVVTLVVPLFSQNVGRGEVALFVMLGLFYSALGLLQGYSAVGLWRLRSWARTVGIVLSAIGLLGFPIGTLISAYCLYLLLSQKGAIVFSPMYREIVEQTPHVKYTTSIVVWILLGILTLVIALIVVAALVTT